MDTLIHNSIHGISSITNRVDFIDDDRGYRIRESLRNRIARTIALWPERAPEDFMTVTVARAGTWTN